MDDSIFTGYYEIGDTLPILVQCRSTAGTPTAPASAPTYRIYDSSGTLVANGTLAASDTDSQTGLRYGSLTLSVANGFSVGVFHVRVAYTVSATAHAVLSTFQVV